MSIQQKYTESEDDRFKMFCKNNLQKIGGIKHIIVSEKETGMLLGKYSRYSEPNLNLMKISSLMSHFFSIGESECENGLNVSINEFKDYKILSTRSKDRIISVVADNQTQVGLVRMLLRKFYYEK